MRETLKTSARADNAEQLVKLRARGVVIYYWLQRARKPFLAVDRIDLEVAQDEFLAISGCGKTTLLDSIEGLHPFTNGEWTLNGTRIERPGSDRAMVFRRLPNRVQGPGRL
jgi:NitT/TauT family transport system ATP-binding protein